MPNRSIVQDFADTVERGDYLGAIERFYAEGASMQENQSEPRVGRDTLLAGEKGVMGRFDRIIAKRVGGILIDGDEVAIRWHWTFVKGEKTSSFEEVSLQTWDGDKILRETFFYDPKQMMAV